ncbi:MAG: hypothetical protein C5B50_22170 [Verrucomicrobia bacterium]|nr:MAG: hypothetical protein C5B50_22170 [Verrucomicrobiota bacterium]
MMANNPLDNRIREAAWRETPSQAELDQIRPWLAAHPEAQAQWQAEISLTEALKDLPDVPVASNFTARVLQAVDREAAEQTGPTFGIMDAIARRLPRWAPKAALAGLLIGSAVLSFGHFQQARRTEDAQRLAVASEVASMPSPTILKDFDAIRALDRTPPDLAMLDLFK